MLPPDGTVNASIRTEVQSERSAALATLLTVHVARFAVSVFDDGTATATATREARRRNVETEGMLQVVYLGMQIMCPEGLYTNRGGPRGKFARDT